MDIPYENSMQIMESLTSEDVDIVLRKTGNHRLMRKSDCVLTMNVLDLMIKEHFPNIQTKNNSSSSESMSQMETREIQSMMMTAKL